MLVTHLSFAQTPSDPRNIRLINSSSTMELAPPRIWFARAMEPQMRPPLVDKERNLMESLYSPFFFSLGDNPRMSKKCGRCSEISEGNETSHLKGVDNSTRLWQLDTATGQALRPQTTASAIERICPKFNSYNACLASCIICLTKEFYPRLVRWRMQHNTLTQL